MTALREMTGQEAKLMRPKQGDNSTRPFINVTPLIDVLLVLLIIFMVAIPLRPSRFRALIPTPLNTEAPPVKMRNDGLRVDVLSDLRLQLNGQDAGTVNDTGALKGMLAEIFQQRTSLGYTKPGTDRIEKTVFVKAPRSIKYGEVVKVIDGIKGAGAEPIGLQVDDLKQ
ncbi:MAG TPA: biopolymer transporter ExbD [Pyrinomonadaceae bacterium]